MLTVHQKYVNYVKNTNFFSWKEKAVKKAGLLNIICWENTTVLYNEIQYIGIYMRQNMPVVINA